MSALIPSDALAAAVAERPDAPALVSAGEVWSYRRLWDEAHRALATWFAGLNPGTAVGVEVSPGDPAAVAALWGAWLAGLVAVPFPAGAYPPICSRLRRVVVVREGGVEVLENPGGNALVSLPGDLALVATSGTSRASRWVRITPDNVAAAVWASRQVLGNGPGDTWLLCVPLHHVAGLSVLWRSAEAGGTVRLATPFDPADTASILRRAEAQWASVVPTMLRRVLDADQGPYPDGLRGILVGGAAADAALLRRAREALLPVLATYGMTETCSQVSTVAPHEVGSSSGTVGRPLPGVQVFIDAEQGLVGRIAVDGPVVSPGYLDEAARAGALQTQDLGRLDAAGRLVVVGRADAVIVTGGENVQPQIVESAISSHPGVLSVAVFGVPDDEWGELVAAAVVQSEPLEASELARYAGRLLDRHEIPKRWHFVDELPLLPGGKVDPRALREL